MDLPFAILLPPFWICDHRTRLFMAMHFAAVEHQFNHFAFSAKKYKYFPQNL
jgi:hypothetical protein